MKYVFNSLMTIALRVFIDVITGSIGTGFIISIIVTSLFKVCEF